MKLYPRKLHSVEELKREKHVLKYAIKHTENESWFDFDNGKAGEKEGLVDSGMIGSVLSAVTSKSLFGTIMAVAPPVFKLITKRSRKKNIAETLARDIAGAYIKWKAIQLSIRTAKKILTSARDKKQGNQRR